MMEINLYMNVHSVTSTPRGRSKLMARKMFTEQAPNQGQRIELWRDGPLVEVKETYWRSDGTIRADLANMVIDPDETEGRWSMELIRKGEHHRAPHFWYTARDGEPWDLLTIGGWSEYEPEKETSVPAT